MEASANLRTKRCRPEEELTAGRGEDFLLAGTLGARSGVFQEGDQDRVKALAHLQENHC